MGIRYIDSLDITESFLDNLDIDNEKIILNNTSINEESYFNKVSMLIDKLTCLNKTNYVYIPLLTIKYLLESPLYEKIANYSNLIFKFNSLDISPYNELSSKELLSIIDSLTNFLKPIIFIQDNLSPLEIFLLVYNKVSNFKTYKPYPKNYLEEDKMHLKNLFSSMYTNCMDYTKLLTLSLSYFGINAMQIFLTIDELKEDNYIPIYHTRSIVRIKDDKYNINGIYLSDPTWDKDDLFVHALFTYRDSSNELDFERLTILDYFFDVTNMAEYEERMQVLLRKTKYSLSIYYIILDVIQKLEPNLYIYLKNKYQNLLVKDFPLEEFLSEVGLYITSVTNKKVSLNLLVDTYANLKNNLIERKVKKLKKKNILYASKYFQDIWPYDMEHKRK